MHQTHPEWTLSFQKSIPKSRFQNPFIKLLQPVRPMVLRTQYVKQVVRYDTNGGNFNIEFDRTAPYQTSRDLFFPYLFGLGFFWDLKLKIFTIVLLSLYIRTHARTQDTIVAPSTQ